MIVMGFDYFYGDESEGYAFYRTPKIFFTDERFRGLTTDARILYGILLDRVSLSKEHGCKDDRGRVFVYMTISSVERSLGCAHQKACGLMTELSDFGLIERTKQGQGKPDRIYVKNFIPVCKSYIKEYENHTSGGMKIKSQEVWKSASNNTDINNTEYSNTNPILSAAYVDKEVDRDMDARYAYEEYLNEQLSLDILLERYPLEKDTLDSIKVLMLDVICSKRDYIRIAGDDKPTAVVKSQFMKLNSMHIEYVLGCLKENGSKVRNIKQYLLAALYNAPLTMNSYYQAWVNNDMAEGRL